MEMGPKSGSRKAVERGKGLRCAPAWKIRSLQLVSAREVGIGRDPALGRWPKNREKRLPTGPSVA